MNFTQTPEARTPPHRTLTASSDVSRQPALLQCVSDGLQDDIDREARIQYHREEMELAMRDYEASSCLTDIGRAHFHRIQFEREIAARSPAFIHQLEKDRGLL